MRREVHLTIKCRQYRYEQKLARLLWKVDMKDVHLDNRENINMPGWSAAENDIRRKQKVSAAANGHSVGGGGGFLPVPTFFPESLESMAKRRKSSSVRKPVYKYARSTSISYAPTLINMHVILSTSTRNCPMNSTH